MHASDYPHRMREEARIPIIKLWDYLLVPLQGDISDGQAAVLKQDVLDRIRELGCVGIVVDLSGLWLVDSHLCSVIATLAASARLMGTRTVISGMKPDVALTLQTMGIDLQGVRSARNLEHALTLLNAAHRPSSLDPRRESRSLADEMLARNPPDDSALRDGGRKSS